jgi:hypothetical protein
VSRYLIAAVAATLVLADAAGEATRLDRHGTVVLDGRKVFPIVLAKGPPASGLAEVRAAGVSFLKVGRLAIGRTRILRTPSPRTGPRRPPVSTHGHPELVRAAAAG